MGVSPQVGSIAGTYILKEAELSLFRSIVLPHATLTAGRQSLSQQLIYLACTNPVFVSVGVRCQGWSIGCYDIRLL
jgi:hypothetical protein